MGSSPWTDGPRHGTAPEEADGWTTLFRAPRLKACRERALVLAARGIPHRLESERGGHALRVPSALAPQAAAELASYEHENQGWPPRLALPAAAPGATWGTGLAALLLALAFALQARGAFGRDWTGRGAAAAEAIRGGEWWRAVTALFLHADVVHLASNLVYGSLFGFLACWTLGGGLGWLAILAAGVLGNLSNAWIQGSGHVSIGASTAVFGAVGVMAGAEWRRRRIFREPLLRRWAPIVVAVLLLSTMGIEAAHPLEERRFPGRGPVDVLAHVTGMVWGLPLGFLAASHDPRTLASRRAQLAFGALSLAAALCAFALALA